MSTKTNNVLENIVAYKRQVVDTRKQSTPLDTFINELTPSDRSFFNALSNRHSDFILECKKASPSKGLIRDNFVLEEILDTYKDYASAISILTDEKYFQGNLNYIAQAKSLVEQPILCKDFFIDTYQVFEARKYGADAILLMLSVLNDEDYKKLAAVAEQLSLDVLTEVHDEVELERAIDLNAKIIGINNRNLKNLEIDLAVTEKLAPKISEHSDSRIIISESGIESHKDISRLSPLVNGFLIGSSIMAKDNIRHHCKALLFGNIKICGLTKPDDAISIDNEGANFAGLIFYPPSPRFVTLDNAKDIVESADLRFVGVFVDENIEVVIDTAKALSLFAVQLHGRESEEYIKQLRQLLDANGLGTTQIWKAIHVTKQVNFVKDPLVDRYLLDNFDPAQIGGTGETFNWSLLDDIDSSELILAGGIDVNNITSARTFSHYAIDLSSGVEDSPGNKSNQKINALFATLRA